MDQCTQCIHFFTIQQNIHLHDIAVAVADRMIIKRSISAGLAFQFIVKIKYDLCQWHFKYQLHAGGGQITLVDQDSSFAEAKRHDIADIFGLGNDLCFDKRLFNAFNLVPDRASLLGYLR